jgi:signal transduction histidine kinase
VIAGQYLGDLLNQLLEMGRVEADETSVRIEPVPVAEIVAPLPGHHRSERKSAA